MSISDERLAKRINNLEFDLTKNLTAHEREMREEGLSLLRELQSLRAASASDDEVEAAIEGWRLAHKNGATSIQEAMEAALRAAAKVRAIREGDGEVAQGSCASCNGTGDTGGNPSYGMCPDCDGTGKFPPSPAATGGEK